jgi:hypothetical protein
MLRYRSTRTSTPPSFFCNTVEHYEGDIEHCLRGVRRLHLGGRSQRRVSAEPVGDHGGERGQLDNPIYHVKWILCTATLKVPDAMVTWYEPGGR